jgi:ribosomal-protein-serine acetyltransferase
MEDFLDEIPDEELQGERVTLRLLHEGDAAPLFTLIDGSRAFLSQHLPWPAECQSAEDVAARIDSWEIQAQMANGACWGIFEQGARSLTSAGVQQPAGNLAGIIILGWIQAQHRSATVSYWLGEPFTGRGLATDALRTLSRYAFDQLGLNRLEISAAVSNPRSAAVATRAGFTQEGFCREYEFINGKFLDHVRFSLLARDPR